jgi:tetratricopeptide (TPR) repeat protein
VQSKKPVTAEGDRAKLVRRLRGDLDVITLTALRKEPARRYASVDQFSHDIALHLEGEPVTARPDTWAYRAQKFLGRHQTGAVVAAVIAVALIVTAATAIYFAAVAEKHKEMALNLASFVVGDFDTAMQSGVTSARKAAMERVLSSLHELSPEARDPALRELLFKAYIRVGDLQGNVYESNLGDYAAAKQSYERALALAKTLKSKSGLAEATTKLGDVEFEAGDRHAALDRYAEARKAYEALIASHMHDRALRSALIRILYKTGLTQLQLGDAPHALASYQRELDLAQHLVLEPGARPEDRSEVAKAEEHVGRLLMQMDRIPEAQAHVSRAVGIYRELLNQTPTSFTARSDWAMASALAAEGAVAAGDLQAAQMNYEESGRVLERLIRDDPNEQYHLWISVIRSAYAEVLIKRKKMKTAHEVTAALVVDLAQAAERSNAPELTLHQYCWTLLTTPFKDLHNPKVALKAAQRANTLTHGSDPAVLHLLALAWDENRDPHEAIEVERRALALLPAGSSEKRREIESSLGHFESELKLPSPQ